MIVGALKQAFNASHFVRELMRMDLNLWKAKNRINEEACV